MNTWNIPDQRIVDVIIKHHYICEWIDEEWYLSDCPLVWNKLNPFQDGTVIKSTQTLLEYVSGPNMHDIPIRHTEVFTIERPQLLTSQKKEMKRRFVTDQFIFHQEQMWNVLSAADNQVVCQGTTFAEEHELRKEFNIP